VQRRLGPEMVGILKYGHIVVKIEKSAMESKNVVPEVPALVKTNVRFVWRQTRGHRKNDPKVVIPYSESTAAELLTFQGFDHCHSNVCESH